MQIITLKKVSTLLCEATRQGDSADASLQKSWLAVTELSPSLIPISCNN